MTIEIPASVFAPAVSEYWQMRERQAANQELRGISDAGNRSAVTGGAQMDGFVRTITELLVAAGVRRDDIHFRMMVTALPGYFRPTKRWDMVIVSGGVLLAAIELKSQVGSLGNNFNNRTEEAMGSALDIWTAYREGAFGNGPQPWLGYLFMLEDTDRARSPVRSKNLTFQSFQSFEILLTRNDTSYFAAGSFGNGIIRAHASYSPSEITLIRKTITLSRPPIYRLSNS